MKYLLLAAVVAVALYIAIVARGGHDDDPFAQPWGHETA